MHANVFNKLFFYCSFALMQKNQKIKAPEKWLKFIACSYSEEAYYRLSNIAERRLKSSFCL